MSRDPRITFAVDALGVAEEDVPAIPPTVDVPSIAAIVADRDVRKPYDELNVWERRLVHVARAGKCRVDRPGFSSIVKTAQWFLLDLSYHLTVADPDTAFYIEIVVPVPDIMKARLDHVWSTASSYGGIRTQRLRYSWNELLSAATSNTSVNVFRSFAEEGARLRATIDYERSRAENPTMTSDRHIRSKEAMEKNRDK